MAKWKVDISNEFDKVRKMLCDAETGKDCIMYELERCCDVLTPDSKADWIWYNSFRDLKSEIHEEVEYMDDDFELCEDIVNAWLNEFYDLCDNAKVWLGI